MGPGSRQNKQSTHPNDDEERLEQMSHPKNQGDGTDDAPRKVEWTCLGLHGLAMERSCSLWWRGCSGTTVFPQTQRVRLVRLSLFGCDLTTSISSKGIQGQAMENLRERTNRRLLRQLSKKYSTSRCFAQRSSRARGRLKRMDTDGLEELGFSLQKSHQRSQSTGCVLVRKAPTNPVRHQHHRSKADSDGVSNRDRVVMST